MGLKDWARKKNRELHRQALEDRDSRLWHSHAYHRYFEGYTEYRELDQNGKEHLRRVYTSSWHIQDLTKKQRILVRCLYVFLFLLMAGAVALAGFRQTAGGKAFYVVIPVLAVLCVLMWLGYILLVNYLFLPEKMTVHDYRASSVSLSRAALVLVIAFLASAALSLLEGALIGDISQTAIPAAAFLLGAVCAFLMRWTEGRIPWREEENTQNAKPGGVPVEGEE